MPEIFTTNLFSTSSQNLAGKSSHWLNSDVLEKDRIMSSLNLSHEYPDIDEILDVGDPDDLVSGGLEPVSLNIYDGSYIEDLSHLCSENSEITQQHYQSKIDVQNTEDFSHPNEEGLLEALQRSMENFESSTMSDLASLTASLGLNFPGSDLSSPSSTDDLFVNQPPLDDHSSAGGAEDMTPLQSPEEELVSVDEQTDMDEEEKPDSSESMLKQLLLNPNHDYRKEVDSVSNRIEHIDKVIGNTGHSLESQRQIRKMKKKKLPNKPFTELLKHLESTNTAVPPVCANQAKPKTRILNAKNYMRQYGSAPVSRVNSPEPDAATNANQPKKAGSKSSSQRSKNSRNNTLIPKKPLQVTKIYPISQSPVTTLHQDQKHENMIVAPDLDSLLDMFESEASRSAIISSNKKDAEPLAFRPSADKRKGTVLIEPLPKKRPRNLQEDSEKKSKCESEVVSVCYEKPSSDHDYCEKQANVTQNGQLSTLGESAETKVVQWEEYLQRVRYGTRSAPNSPIASPKPPRRKAKKDKVEKSPTEANKVANVTTGKSCQRPSFKKKLSPKPAIKLQEVQDYAKPTIKLQEFQEYLANLKNKQKKRTTSAEVVTPTVSDYTKNTLKLIQPSSSITVSLSSGRPVVQQAKSITLTQPFIKVTSGGKMHTAVTSSQIGPNHSAAPLVMIRIPAQQNVSSIANAASLPHSCPDSLTNVAPQTLVFPVGKTPVSAPSKPIFSVPVTSASVPKMKPVSKSKRSDIPRSTQVGKEAKNPTFKLMTSSQGKSLILSNVTGQLKEILTALAQQQQQQGTSSSQQKTLQKLLATITSMKKKQPEENVVSNSSLVSSSGTLTTAIPGSHVLEESISPADALRKCHSGLEVSDNATSINTKNAQCKKYFDRASHIVSSEQSSENVRVETQTAPICVSQNIAESTISPADICQTLGVNKTSSFESKIETSPSPVNNYVKSVIETTVDKLLDRVVVNCDVTADATVVCNEVSSTEKLTLTRTLTFTKASFSNAVPSIGNTQPSECDGNILDQHSKHTVTRTNAGVPLDDEQYYNKLPAYLYSGKLLQKNTEKIKDEPESANIEFNKLPHYFSSGKLAPSDESILYGSNGHLDIGMEQEIGFAAEVKCTPEGKVIDPELTFYSRLPSYYGYGRTHLVDAVTDPPAMKFDETVTKQSINQQNNEKNLRVQKSQEHSEKRRQTRIERICDDRIMYSKIPSYLLSGRQTFLRERRLSEMSSLSESSDSEGATSTSGRRRLTRMKKSSFHDWETKLQKRKEDEAKNQAILQRRVMYVGGISEITSKPYLRARFEKFGAIDDVTLYFRKGKDNYAFVTFRYSNDVIQAIEHGNDNMEPKFTLCFGGRRHFCKVAYADLDEKGGKNDDEIEEDFDTLLQRAMHR